MKKFNLALHYKTPGSQSPALVMCCFSVPDHVPLVMVSNSFQLALSHRIEKAKRSGSFNLMKVVTCAMQDVAERLSGIAILLDADAIAFLDLD